MTQTQYTLEGLPVPAIIATLSYEEIRLNTINKLVDIDPTYSALLESDPAIKVIEAASYDDLVLRQRVNDAARANLLFFARGADLDHLAAFYDVLRLVGETDSALQTRTILAIQGRSTGGTEEQYKYVARTADVRVKDVAVYQVDGGPKLRVALLSAVNGGVPDTPMLAAVTAAVTAPGVRAINDVIEVVSATQAPQNIVLNVWLLPNAPLAIIDSMETLIRSAWFDEGGIGFDLNPSWITARVHLPGVSRVVVVSPAAPVVENDNQAATLGTITVNFAGRSR
ncbi:baseplate J/gp47 family protein [Mesorhizobium sp. C120A]|uniref:baseplate J/gp47 family protein n=1 Tax=unclassified Mesorhizobium TaxID=325217 RepID=UPI0003D00A06|nr:MULTISPECIES: baseplate J/gp47 family protein [unclassified Mesorhizobium]ESZ63515.1 baseplate J protein [Mesorhizobium sp. L103C120A0]WJI45106.1 baseplate J/gp47 family protein [Mesorhizobium sp. C120A]